MKKIAILVGHGKSAGGGYDPGACANGREEFQLAKEIAKYACEELNNRYDCQADLFNYDGKMKLTDRVKRFKNDTYALLAEIHLNAGGGTGTEVYYSTYSRGKLGQQAAERISAGIAEAFGLRNRGAKRKLRSDGRDYFAIIRDTKPHAVLVETLFLDNKGDLEKVTDAAGQKKMGQTIAEGIGQAMGLKKKATSAPTPAYRLYTVKKGDSFWRIAAQQMGSGLKYRKLAAFNGLKPTSTIYAGQILKIPTEGK